MKNIVAICLVVLVASTTFAQKVAYANFEYILRNMDLKAVESDVQLYTQQYQAQLQQMGQEIQALQAELENASLPAPILETKGKEYETKVQAFQTLQQQAELDIMQKQDELLKPYMEKIQNAAKELAKEKGYSVVLNEAGASTLIIIYADEKDNLTKAIFGKLGIEWKDPKAEVTAGAGNQ